MAEVGSIQHVGGDTFSMDGKTYDLQTLMMTLGIQRAEEMDKQLGNQLQTMKDRNTQLRSLNDILSKVRVNRPSGDGTGKVPDLTDAEKNVLRNAGITLGTGDLKAAEYDAKVIEAMKTGIDNVNSTSQLETIRMQSISDKRDLAYKMLSNQIDKLSNTMGSIVQNMK